jgi:Domain of unknown function (DUF3850)
MQKREKKRVTTMKEHELKCWPDHFRDICRSIKTFEVRRNDRGFEVGDVLILKCWDPQRSDYIRDPVIGDVLQVRRRITYILPGGQFGIEPDHVLMAIY